jgi:hypothetical protein
LIVVVIDEQVTWLLDWLGLRPISTQPKVPGEDARAEFGSRLGAGAFGIF